MRLILHYLKNYKLLLLLNILSVFGFALVELGIPTIISDMIDQGVTRQDQAYLMQMGLRIAVISVAGVCGTILLGYCCARISTSMTRDIRQDVFAKVQTLSHSEMNQIGVASDSDVYECDTADSAADAGDDCGKLCTDNLHLASAVPDYSFHRSHHHFRCGSGGKSFQAYQ